MVNIIDILWRISFYMLPGVFLICIIAPRHSTLYRAANVFMVLYFLGGIYVFVINAMSFGSYDTDISFVNQLDRLSALK